MVSSDGTAEELMELNMERMNQKDARVLSIQGPGLLGLSSLKII